MKKPRKKEKKDAATKPKKEKKPKPEDELVMQFDQHGNPIIDDVFAGMNLNDLVRMDHAADAKAAKKGKTKDGKAKAPKRNSAIVDVPPPMNAQMPLPPQFPVGTQPFIGDPMVVNVNPEAAPVKKPKKKKELTGFAAWMAGQPPKPSKKDDEKLELSTSNHSHSQSLYAIPIAGGNGIARRRRSTAGSSWTTASASASPPVAKVVATAEQGSCTVM